MILIFLNIIQVKYENVEKNKAGYVDKCNHDGIAWSFIHNKAI